MHSFNIISHSEKKMSMNGKIMMDKEFDLDYNGKIMNLSEKEYGKTALKSRLTNNDIMKLMSKPSSKLTLLERLEKDYNLKKSTRKIQKKAKSIKKKGGKRTRTHRKKLIL